MRKEMRAGAGTEATRFTRVRAGRRPVLGASVALAIFLGSVAAAILGPAAGAPPPFPLLALLMLMGG